MVSSSFHGVAADGSQQDYADSFLPSRIQALNQMGEAGWELVAAEKEILDTSRSTTYWFKRQK